MVFKPLVRGELVLNAPGVRRAIVSFNWEQLTEEERERQVPYNLEKSEELVEEL